MADGVTLFNDLTARELLIGGAALCLVLAVVARIVRMRGRPARRGGAPRPRGKGGKARAQEAIGERLSALKVETEELETAPNLRRHFGDRPATTRKYQLRRR
jgi:hypothetical protein